jgi:hypothetical protein
MIVVPDMPPAGQVEVYGEAIPGGVECPLVRARDGQVYSLVSAPTALKIGDQVRILGEFQLMSFCMQGQTIRVDQLELIEAQHAP